MNPFAHSRNYARMGNVIMRPMFRLFPVPDGFTLLTTVGRRSGKPRSQPVRAVRRDKSVYITRIMLAKRPADWLRNVRANPRVRVKMGRRSYEGVAREVTDPSEREAAASVYLSVVTPFDYFDYASLYWGFPTRRKIDEVHRRWVREGTVVRIDLEEA
ncbi:MAG: nitroreductase family deazaflavin-dependent oxidoreductase [Chloroflexi bacterium]|nr:nitroreductase family deazaflavin-dependent oxidoreductase [Chloroflexota bacterium]